jgi:DNA-binding CsgD family transcriptional regulator
MGRLVVGIELAAVVVGIAAVSAGGSLSLLVSLVPLLFVIAVPLIGGFMAWTPAELARAFRDASSTGRLPARSAASAQVWELLERAAYLGGLLGVVLAASAFFSRLGSPGGSLPAKEWSAVALFALYAVLYGTLFRVLRGTVRSLAAAPVPALDLSLTRDFRRKYRLSDRECQVITLVLEGRKYREIAEELFISIKTVKTHVTHVYDKTGTAGRVELIRLLQFDTGG